MIFKAYIHMHLPHSCTTSSCPFTHSASATVMNTESLSLYPQCICHTHAPWVPVPLPTMRLPRSCTVSPCPFTHRTTLTFILLSTPPIYVHYEFSLTLSSALEQRISPDFGSNIILYNLHLLLWSLDVFLQYSVISKPIFIIQFSPYFESVSRCVYYSKEKLLFFM